MSFLLPMLHAIAPYAASALGLFLLHRLRSPRDHERADLLVTIANSVAATLAVEYPQADWATLLAQVIAQLRTVLGDTPFPEAALRREAIRALSSLGRLPTARTS